MSNQSLDESDIDNLYEAAEIAVSKNKEVRNLLLMPLRTI
jgi:hypothetical protein